MNDLARQKLVKLVDTQTPALMEDSERFEAFLRDYCGECKPEISAILAALEEDIPRDLRRMRGQPYPLLREQLANRLQDDRSLHQEAALWAVESWAVALEIAPGSQRQHGGAGAAPESYAAAPPMQPMAPMQAGSLSQSSAPRPSQQMNRPPMGTPSGFPPNTFPPSNIGQPGGPPVVVYPRYDAGGGGAGNVQQPPAWQQGWTAPQAVQQTFAAPPKHNSFMVGGICAAIAVIMGIVASNSESNSSAGTFGGLLVLVFALAGAMELILGYVRNSLGKAQAPDFVTSSMAFWMKMFAMEDRILGIFGTKHGAELPAGGAQYPAPAAPVFSQTRNAVAQAGADPPAAQPTTEKAPGENVFCIACGTTNSAGAIFCLSCGERLYYPGAEQIPPAN
ncbi:MAG TPA: hypothetical protein VGZ48_10130 [Candidatus Acidoferrales bacterium]|jgi:hypothetical protein|nr:hypothetical protein [Candidatus Acidoferrales bacterium]